MDDAACLTLASEAAGAWGRLAAPLRLVQRRENAVYEARFEGGLHAALRLHRPGYQGADSVAQEMLLTERLADAGFACPWPQRRGDGALTHVSGGVVVSLVQWMEGRTLAEMPAERLPELYRRLGAVLSDLHLTADAVAPQMPSRPCWDAEALCGDKPLWGRFWEHPALEASERTILLDARDAARARIGALCEMHCGPIHGDVLMENVLVDGGALTLIDFDDCGIGYRALDLATALIQHADSLQLAELRAALLAGYSEAGGHFHNPAETVSLFLALRAMASCGWAAERLPSSDPRQKAYCRRAVAQARTLLS